MSLLARFEKLSRDLLDAESVVEKIKGEMKEVELALLDEFADTGMKSANINGSTVYLRNDTYVRKATGLPTEAVLNALRANNLGDMISEGYPAATLKAVVKEMIDEKIPLPDSLARVLDIGTVSRIIVRRS